MLSVLLGGSRGQGPPRRRDRLEIALHVLRILRELGPLRKTRLMQLANLNTRSFADHVDGFLVSLGLVEKRAGLYAATPLGVSVYNVLRILEGVGVFNSARKEKQLLRGVELAESLGGVLEEEANHFRVYRLPCGVVLHIVKNIRSPEASFSLVRALSHVLAGSRTLIIADDVDKIIKISIEDNTIAYIVHPSKALEVITNIENCNTIKPIKRTIK